MKLGIGLYIAACWIGGAASEALRLILQEDGTQIIMEDGSNMLLEG